MVYVVSLGAKAPTGRYFVYDRSTDRWKDEVVTAGMDFVPKDCTGRVTKSMHRASALGFAVLPRLWKQTHGLRPTGTQAILPALAIAWEGETNVSGRVFARFCVLWVPSGY